MPAANFGRSDYITLGFLVDTYELTHDEIFMSDIREEALEHWEVDNDYEDLLPDEQPDLDDIVDELIYRQVQDEYEDNIYIVENKLSNLNLHYYDITIESGYYEGMYLNIELSFDEWDLDSEDLRENIYKEISEIGEFLISLAEDYGWRTVSSTCYSTYRAELPETLEDIQDAIMGMMQQVQEFIVNDPYEPGNE